MSESGVGSGDDVTQPQSSLITHHRPRPRSLADVSVRGLLVLFDTTKQRRLLTRTPRQAMTQSMPSCTSTVHSFFNELNKQ